MTLKFNTIDVTIYDYIRDKKEINFEDVVKDLSFNLDEVRRTLETLKVNGIISEKADSTYIYELDINGKKALDNGLIEKLFCDFIANNPIAINELQNQTIEGLEKQEISLAFGIAKRKNLVNVVDGIIQPIDDYNNKLNIVVDELNKINSQDFDTLDDEILKELIKRKNFIIKKEVVSKSYKFLNLANYILEEDKTLFLTPELLKSGNTDSIEFKEFDVEKLPKPQQVGRIHPLRQIMYYIRDLYLEMGFKEMESPYVETCFWNLDAMFISQDHPARDVQDTYFLPIKGDLPDNKELLDEIKKLHLNGSDCGSTGYGYNWSEEDAKPLILRTHTTAATYRKFYELKDKRNTKYFCIDKVFRNETTDASHLPEFHQAEGFVIGENLGLADLMGFIKEFLGKLGIDNIKFKPNYNPYTEPSIEAFAYLEKDDKWIELINAGVFRPESLKPYGITQSVIAWGLGIERVAMVLYQKNIKELHGDECNLDWLRTYPIPKRVLE